ncbi:MAG TPA: DUF1707 domain-containing protein [Streptosporangiaceae bacterium]|jgi:hypothetical protein
MNDRQLMRASDGDRDEVVARLRTALEDGRLKMDEYMDRMGLAYEAVTYGDLAKLHADLPGPARAPKVSAPVVPGAATAAVERRGVFAELPTALKVLWTIWAVPVAINVVVWTLVCITTDHLVYPWPLWVAGPLGAALFAVTAGVTASRRSRRPAPRRLPGS